MTQALGDAMVTLKIDLQAGFSGDRVQVLVDGETILEADEVSTDYSIGHAASAETEVEPGSHQVEIRVPAKQVSESVSVTVEGPVFVGVSLDDGRLEVRVSEQPFIYL